MALVLINVDLAGHRSLDVLSTTNSVAAKWSVSQMGRRGRRALIKDLKRKANSLSRDIRQANALGLEGGPPPLGNCSTRHD